MSAIFSIDGFAVQVAAYKACYDALIWQNRRVEYGWEYLKIIPIDKKLEEIFEIGKARINQSLINMVNEFSEKIKNSINAENSAKTSFRKNRKERRIQKIVVNNGYLMPLTQKGYSSMHLIYDANIYEPINSYYGFIQDAVMPNAAGLKIKDVALIDLLVFDFKSFNFFCILSRIRKLFPIAVSHEYQHLS